MDRIPRTEVVRIAVNREGELALANEHELLARVAHGVGTAIGVGLDRRLGAADEANRSRRVGFVDEVTDAAPEGRGDLHQARDGGRHAALLDLVDGGSREVGALGELCELPPALRASFGDLGPQLGNRALDLREELWSAAGSKGRGWSGHAVLVVWSAAGGAHGRLLSYTHASFWAGGRSRRPKASRPAESVRGVLKGKKRDGRSTAGD